jgi:hypothetical protein
MSEISDDPLTDEFAELERDVKRRRLLATQVDCPHVTTHTVRNFAGVSRTFCVACGAWLTLPPE